MTLIAVRIVHPPADRISLVAKAESNSNIIPAPWPISFISVVITVSIRIVGMTISFADMAKIYATRIIPFKPGGYCLLGIKDRSE